MLDNQRFHGADSRIIFIKVLHDHCHIGGPLSPMREAGFPWNQNPNMFGQLFIWWNNKKGYHPKLSILWTTRLSSRSLRFSKLTVLLWMVVFVCPSHHLLTLYFFCVVIPSKRLGLSVLTQLQKFRWSWPRFEACLWRHSVHRRTALPGASFGVLFQLYLWTKQQIISPMFCNNPRLFPRNGCGPTHVHLLSRPYWYFQFTSEIYLPPRSFCDLQMIWLCLVAAVVFWVN